MCKPCDWSRGAKATKRLQIVLGWAHVCESGYRFACGMLAVTNTSANAASEPFDPSELVKLRLSQDFSEPSQVETVITYEGQAIAYIDWSQQEFGIAAKQSEHNKTRNAKIPGIIAPDGAGISRISIAVPPQGLEPWTR